MSATDRTPVVLALLADALQVRAADRPDDHDLHALADGVALAVDHGAAAGLWPPTGIDTGDAEVIKDMILDDVTFGAANDRPMLVAVARRLADVAASLRVRGEVMRSEAETLWRAASRLLGLDALRRHPNEMERATIGWKIEHEIAEKRKHEIGLLQDDLASMTEQRDEAVRQRDEARQERDNLAGARQAEARKPGDDGGEPTSVRNTRSVVVLVAPNPGAHLGTIAEAVMRSVPLDDPKTYVVRSTGAQRQEYVETPEDRLRRHRARWCLHGRPEVECPECSVGYG